MQDILDESLSRLKRVRIRRNSMLSVLLILSLIVSLNVFWTMRKTGMTLAGDADCGIVEHTHDDSCPGGEATCSTPEHQHSILCYSDESADLESQLDWQKMFANYPFTGDLHQDLAGIAKAQVGYTESKLNFEVSRSGVRRGYTRYGAWYGAPYSDWSAMFVSFCLNYAGADPKEYPFNTGAASMAEQWKKAGRYAPVGRHDPVCGDLVFFKNNTVGIVAEVQSATLYVIRGDVENSVRGTIVPRNDSTIAGWGLLTRPTNENSLLDITHGPAVFIFEGDSSAMKEPPKQKTRAKGYALKTTQNNIIDLITYLNENGGSYFFTLLDKNNQPLPKDDNGNYIVIADTGYKLTISFNAPEGFLPGEYHYQIPDGLVVDGGNGEFTLNDNTNVGSWEVTDDGVIILNFNDQINNHTDITISATLGIHFPENEDPLDFDGKISVSVQKPPEEAETTHVTKWGMQGNEETAGKTDPTKIYWNVSITGKADSQIPGSVITDKTLSGDWLGDHRYTESDMAAGLRFGVSDPNWEWHAWTVYPGDPNLTWTESGWSYTMPETITCWCGEVTLGNEGWIYYIDYSSTPDPSSTPGSIYYMNRISADNQFADGGASFTHGEILAEVNKDGTFVSDASGSAFLWEFQVTIPARKEDQKAEYHWYIMDYMYLLNGEGNNAGPVNNDANLSTVTATYNGTTINVPKIQDATENDPFAWDNAWSPESNGIYYGREINLLHRCICNESNCQFWNGYCQKTWYDRGDGVFVTGDYCQCWATTENVTFTFTYKTEDLSLIEDYGGLGYNLLNIVELYYKPNGGSEGSLISNSQTSVPIPGLFKKDLTQDFNGYTAHYNITVNEAKLVLTDGSPLYIHDTMSNTLAYISGSLVITAEDSNGNRTTLRQEDDFTVSYDGTGSETDASGNGVHVLDIVILNPQPVKYILDYDTTIIMPDQVTEGVKYSNSANITLWGKTISDSSIEKVHADINIAAKSFKVEMFKTSSLTGEPLGGATFGLYNSHDGLITTEVSDSNGQLAFKTSIIEGIILREHVLYYIQELKAPAGYQLDDTKHWFCFCDKTEGECSTCKTLLEDIDAIRIPSQQIGKVNVTNTPISYNMPETGGSGVYPLILVSVMLIVTPLVYKSILRHKRERRGAG